MFVLEDDVAAISVGSPSPIISPLSSPGPAIPHYRALFTPAAFPCAQLTAVRIASRRLVECFTRLRDWDGFQDWVKAAQAWYEGNLLSKLTTRITDSQGRPNPLILFTL